MTANDDTSTAAHAIDALHRLRQGNRPWPSKEEVTAHYRARARANDQIGQYLSAALTRPDLNPSVRRAIEFWFEFHPECRY